MGSGIGRAESGITGSESVIRDHKSWDRGQPFFEGSRIGLYHFCGITDQIFG